MKAGLSKIECCRFWYHVWWVTDVIWVGISLADGLNSGREVEGGGWEDKVTLRTKGHCLCGWNLSDGFANGGARRHSMADAVTVRDESLCEMEFWIANASLTILVILALLFRVRKLACHCHSVSLLLPLAFEANQQPRSLGCPHHLPSTLLVPAGSLLWVYQVSLSISLTFIPVHIVTAHLVLVLLFFLPKIAFLHPGLVSILWKPRALSLHQE